jgi:WS/DGAT/MGAT family acyltransferase
MATTDDQPLTWGSTRDLNPMEVLMWRAEASPQMRSTILALEILDHVPDWDRFVAAHEWGSRMVPRFRRRIVDPGYAPPGWAADTEFDLEYHVRRVSLPPGATFDDLLRTASTQAMTPFDTNRPPWEATLYENLPGGKAGYALKMHHSATDGLGTIQLLTALHSTSHEGSPDKPQPPLPAAETYSATDALVRQAAGDARSLAGMLRRRVGALAHPRQSLVDGARFASSLRRVLADPDTENSPLLKGRSLKWRFLALDVQFADLRAAAKAAGGSVNDAFLAALLAGFRLYHEELGSPIDTLPMALPISIRRDDDKEGGNRFAGARLAAPVGILDPVERIQIIREMVLAARSEPAMEGIALIAPAIARLPAPVIARVASDLTKASDLQASNIPGLQGDVFLAGARVERLYPYAPLPGVATMITLMTHGKTGCVGINLDPAAIQEPMCFGRCLAAGFDEVLALHPGSTPAELRT